MTKYTYQVRNKQGIHVHTAGQLVKLAKEASDTSITITKENKTINATQLMKLLSLELKQGDILHITVDGINESKTIMKLNQFLYAYL